jgi:GNAT superfamily N-acetyltransferase
MVEPRMTLVADAATAEHWAQVHNAIIPPHPLSVADVLERATRNRLELAYLGDVPVGNSTVRPPTDEEPAATVIARVLPAYRRQGIGGLLYRRGLAHALAIGATHVETVVLASNSSGLRFATAHGFVEVERYLLPGDTDPYVTLRLAASDG